MTNRPGMFVILLMLAVGLISGCAAGGQTVVTATQPLPPTETAAPTVRPTATSDATATLTATATPTTTATATATTTRFPTRRATRAPAILVSTPHLTATAEPDIAATLVAGTSPRLYAGYPSPDGKLRAEILIHDCVVVTGGQEYAYDILRLVEIDSGESRFIDGQLQNCGGLGAFGMTGLFWSPSGRYFYYTEAREGVPEGCGYWTRPMSRVDTVDWKTADLGGGPISPDGSLLAVWDERELVVYEVDGEERGRVDAAAAGAALGPIAWSPDGRQLAYLQAAAFCVPGQSGTTVLVLIDVLTMMPRVLLNSSSPAFQDVRWESTAALRLFDDSGGQWEYDMSSGDLAPVQ